MSKQVTILALGSRGDVQPCVALGAALRAAGYHVRIATFEAFRTLAERHGLDFHATQEGSDVELLKSGHATITPLHYDLTMHGSLGKWSKR